MSILVNKNSRIITQGMTGKTGQFHTRLCRDYGFGKECFVGGVNPKKAGQVWEGLPIFGSVKEAKEKTGANVSVIYVPPAGAAAARLFVFPALINIFFAVISSSASQKVFLSWIWLKSETI